MAVKYALSTSFLDIRPDIESLHRRITSLNNGSSLVKQLSTSVYFSLTQTEELANVPTRDYQGMKWAYRIRIGKSNCESVLCKDLSILREIAKNALRVALGI